MTILRIIVIAILVVLTLGCATQNTHQSKHRHHKNHVAVSKKVEISKETKAEPKIVDLDWMQHYDAMLKMNGDKLNPPKKPGNRTGVTLSGDHDIIDSKVAEDYNTLLKLNHSE